CTLLIVTLSTLKSITKNPVCYLHKKEPDYSLDSAHFRAIQKLNWLHVSIDGNHRSVIGTINGS
ncbi:hypothetical protein ACP3V3_21840, partial [Vibrio sp. PNB22_3_1]